MTFFVRNISLAFLLFALLAVLGASYLAGRVHYEATLNRTFAERAAQVSMLGTAALERDDAAAVGAIDRALELSARPGTQSFRLVDPATRRILASTDDTEVGRAVERPLPAAVFGTTTVNVTAVAHGSVVDVLYLGSGGLLWMTLDRSFFMAPAVLFAVQTAFILSLFIGALALLFYFIARRYFMRPLQILKQSLSGVVPEEAGVKTDDFGVLLQSFAGVAAKVEETLQRDRLVSQMKSDFISTTAHQLRTPLSGINWALGALLTDGNKLTPEQKSLVERALEKDKELINLIGTLLNAASIEEGKFGYHRESISLLEEIQKTVEEERQTAARMKVQLTLALPQESVHEVFADKERIRWVLRNLIENAIRYSNEGGEIVVSLSQDPKQLQVSVKDNGIGISDRDRPYIFQKFFRADAAQKLRNDGSGLGLFIAKNIVNYHGGRIWFETAEGKGSTFYFTLPLARRQPAEVATG